LAPPFDVMDAGRMAVFTDPSGAAFSVWQPHNHQGAGLVNEPGTRTAKYTPQKAGISAGIVGGNVMALREQPGSA
jgi:hypothetical protein